MRARVQPFCLGVGVSGGRAPAPLRCLSGLRGTRVCLTRFFLGLYKEYVLIVDNLGKYRKV